MTFWPDWPGQEEAKESALAEEALRTARSVGFERALHILALYDTGNALIDAKIETCCSEANDRCCLATIFH